MIRFYVRAGAKPALLCYDAFGNTTTSGVAIASRFKYNDEYTDEATNNAANSSATKTLNPEWQGVDNQGVMWHGIYRNGEIKTFFPSD